ncbi:MAG: hypothetical protein QXU18_05555, partial [Thermoplasmatales archaeon]
KQERLKTARSKGVTMMTAFRVDPENESFVKELTRERSLAHILNFLISEYKENKGWKPPEERIAELEQALKKKEQQYEALKKEVEQNGT